MYALILTICMLPVNSQGIAAEEDTCQDAYITQQHKSMDICAEYMEHEMKAIQGSVINEFDWTLSCTKE